MFTILYFYIGTHIMIQLYTNDDCIEIITVVLIDIFNLESNIKFINIIIDFFYEM